MPITARKHHSFKKGSRSKKKAGDVKKDSKPGTDSMAKADAQGDMDKSKTKVVWKKPCKSPHGVESEFANGVDSDLGVQFNCKPFRCPGCSENHKRKLDSTNFLGFEDEEEELEEEEEEEEWVEEIVEEEEIEEEEEEMYDEGDDYVQEEEDYETEATEEYSEPSEEEPEEDDDYDEEDSDPTEEDSWNSDSEEDTDEESTQDSWESNDEAIEQEESPQKEAEKNESTVLFLANDCEKPNLQGKTSSTTFNIDCLFENSAQDLPIPNNPVETETKTKPSEEVKSNPSSPTYMVTFEPVDLPAERAGDFQANNMATKIIKPPTDFLESKSIIPRQINDVKVETTEPISPIAIAKRERKPKKPAGKPLLKTKAIRNKGVNIHITFNINSPQPEPKKFRARRRNGIKKTGEKVPTPTPTSNSANPVPASESVGTQSQNGGHGHGPRIGAKQCCYWAVFLALYSFVFISYFPMIKASLIKEPDMMTSDLDPEYDLTDDFFNTYLGNEFHAV